MPARTFPSCGLLPFLVEPQTISRTVLALTQHELSEDRHDVKVALVTD